MFYAESGNAAGEVLRVNGASIVFYTVCVPKQTVDVNNAALDCGTPIKPDRYGYIENIFRSDYPAETGESLLFKLSGSDIIQSMRLNDTDSVDLCLNHYVLFYSKRAILLQTVILFDFNRIGKHEHNSVTNLSQPLSTTHLLRLIHNIKKSEDFSKTLIGRLNKVLGPLRVSTENCCMTNWNEQNIAIQIWDVASLPGEIASKPILSGESDLAKRYEIDLAALLLLYDERHTSGENWMYLSSVRVRGALDSGTDATVDHRILSSDRVCVEISQIDKPSISDISETRLRTYGYDSTSAFLWGYLSLIESGLNYCNYVLKNLCDSVENELSTDGIKKLSSRRYEVLLLRDQYQSIGKSCIESRHKEFIRKGMVKKHLSEELGMINTLDKRFRDLSNLSIITELKNLQEKFQSYTREQDETNDRISMIGLLLALTSIIPVPGFFEYLFEREFYWWGKLIIIVICIVILGIVYLGAKNKQKKRRLSKQSASNEDGRTEKNIE